MEMLTKRFLLRDFVPEDALAFEAYHADPRSHEFYGDDQAEPVNAKELLTLFSKWAVERPRLNYQLAIVLRDETQTLIGCCGLRSAVSEPGKAELGIEMAPAYWGRYGYAIEVMRALIEFGFGKLGLQEIYGGTVSANFRIARLVKSFGATAVMRTTPEWMSAKGWSQIEWQVTRDQWENGRLTFHSRGRAKARR
jgi:ribosomal-protein-alanine N-acetyltransferase